MANPTPSSKPSAESATVSMPKLVRRYKEDPFFRSTLNVILLQTIFILLVCFVFFFAMQHQQQNTVSALRAHVEMIQSGGSPAPGELSDSFITARNQTLALVLLILMTLTILFGYLAARYALSPTRDTHQTQRRFIGNLAHELRTPLAIMRTDTEVSLMDPKLPKHVRGALESNLEELSRISEIINNLLTFNSLLRPGQISLEPIDLVGVLTLVSARHQELAERRGITLSLQIPSEVRIYGNASALEQVFTNLVKNALNYTPQHDERSVEIRATIEGERVNVTVTDTGIGIAQKDLYHIFEPFYRGDTSRTRNIGGGTSGLGLAIVNDIVRAHGGSITIRSALNRGTAIEISLPTGGLSDTASPQSISERGDEEYEATIVRS